MHAHVTSTLRHGRIVSGFFVVFEALSQVAERIHAMEYLGERFEGMFGESARVPTALVDVLIAAVALLICLRIDRWLAARQLPHRDDEGGAHADDEARREASIEQRTQRVAFRLNARTLSVFTAATALETIGHIAIIEHSAQTLAHSAGPVLAFFLHFWQPIAFSVTAWASIILSRRLWLARLQDVDLPGDEAVGLGELLDTRDLRFRGIPMDPRDRFHAAAARDIRQLATTETYGEMGDTNFKQVFRWWTIYPSGNWVVEYRGRVVGGVDLWPLKKDVYDGLHAGQLGEEDIDRHSLAPQPDTDTGTYWYVGSISIDLRMRHRRYRQAVLAKLVETMLTDNFLPSVTAYPAHVLALIWTKQGQNIAARSGFTLVGERVSAHVAPEPIYEAVFADRAAVLEQAARIRRRLARPGSLDATDQAGIPAVS
jgi:hypothetical protein